MDIAILAILAFLIESMVEYVLGIWWQPGTPAQRKRVIQAVALLLGIIVAFQARLDLFQRYGLNLGFLGEVFTGAIIGRGAQFIHSIIKIAARLGNKQE